MKELDEQEARDQSRLALIGGELCLDFANTAGNHKEEHPSEHLTSYESLVEWSRDAGLASPQAATQLVKQASARGSKAIRVLEQALELREALYRIFSSAAAGRSAKPSDLDILNSQLRQALIHGRLILRQGYYVWEWERSDETLDQMLWPIARSAEQLLTSDKLARVRECEDEICGWLFVDTSKNHSRRWCSMGDCGNRAKARRFYSRRRAVAH